MARRRYADVIIWLAWTWIGRQNDFPGASPRRVDPSPVPGFFR